MRARPSWPAVASSLLAAVTLAACETVPYTGRSQIQLMSPEFLSTHPSETTRIAQIQAWMPEAMQYYKR